MSFLSLAASALLLGFLHGLGGDHLMAIAALAVDGRSDRGHARIIRTAVGFAFGHALVLGIGATVAVVFGVVVPATVSAGAERVGGLILILLGAVGLWGVASGRAYGHIHTENDGRSRWHVHLGGPTTHPRHGHAHSALPTAMGAVFAVSSLRALMLLEPFGARASTLALPIVLLLVALFGLGILLSMSLFGVVFARALSMRAVSLLGRSAAGLVAVASILLGLYWMLA
jgi:hypothetical protein